MTPVRAVPIRATGKTGGTGYVVGGVVSGGVVVGGIVPGGVVVGGIVPGIDVVVVVGQVLP